MTKDLRLTYSQVFDFNINLLLRFHRNLTDGLQVSGIDPLRGEDLSD